MKRRAHPSGYTPSRAFLLSRKKPDCVTHVSGMNCHPSLRKGNRHLVEVARRRSSSPNRHLATTCHRLKISLEYGGKRASRLPWILDRTQTLQLSRNLLG